MASKKRLFLDMDPGIDDAVAILISASMTDVELLGISTVAGNVDVVRTTRNALRISEFLDLRSGVYRGSSRPMIRPHEGSSHVHGVDGLGGVSLPEPGRQADPLPGPMAMVEFARSEPGKVTLVATGPLTNVAIACMLDTEFSTLVGQLVVMGGAFSLTPYGKGNVTPTAEYNIYADPEAANLVFASFPNVLCVGLDVTMNPDLLVRSQDLERLRGSGGSKARLAAEMMEFSVGRLGYFAPHDPLALYSAHDPRILSTVKKVITVGTGSSGDRGRTTLSDGPTEKPPAYVASGVDATRFKEELISLLQQ